MKYEKPQKGNPHQLTVNQHCFPASAIRRFTDADGRVEVLLIKEGKKFRTDPEDRVFCAQRAWDQRAESGFMIEIENDYLKLAELVTSDKVSKLDQDQETVVSRMYSLWNVRWHWGNNPIADQKIHGTLDVAVKYSKDDQEQLEKAGIAVVRPDLAISGRHLTGVSVQRNIMDVVEKLNNTHWGIVRCDEAEFIVPDTSPALVYLPLSPHICFLSQSNSGTIPAAAVYEINNTALCAAEMFCFAKHVPSRV